MTDEQLRERLRNGGDPPKPREHGTDAEHRPTEGLVKSPFDVLAKDALLQHRRGETVSLRRLAEEEGIQRESKDDDET